MPSTDTARSTADEWFEFPGDPARRLPAYWVARHGVVVTARVAGGDSEAVERADLAQARAEWADQTCDLGPGAPQSGDLIDVHWGERAGERILVTASSRLDTDPDAHVVVTDGGGTPLRLLLGQYTIMRRPAVGAVT